MDRHFDEELSLLKKDILKMGDIVHQMVGETINALINRDIKILDPILLNETIVDKMQIDIDEHCLKLIALHQPTAIDLRFLMGVAKINTELERIGDQSINICHKIIHILKYPPVKPYIDMPKMVEITRGMFNDSLHAFIDLDVDKAKSVLACDDLVDKLRDNIINELMNFMCGDSSIVQVALSLILVANSLEKIADHATNIAEVVIFVAQGKDIRHQSEKNIFSST